MVARHPDRLVARISARAGQQHGVVSRAQLYDLGGSDGAIGRLVSLGVLHRVFRAVFAVGHRHLTREGWWMAATLACGEGAVLSHRAAAAVWDMLPAVSTIDVITPASAGIEQDWLRAHRCRLEREDRTERYGLPVTTVARTMHDLSATERSDRIGQALDQALLQHLYDHEEMESVIARSRGHRGIRQLRAAVDRLRAYPDLLRSRPERRARDLLLAAGVLRPQVNAWFPTCAGHGHELDLYWPALLLNVEIDGPHHQMPWQRHHDALRDADLESFSIDVERFASPIVDEAPERFVSSVARLIESRLASTPRTPVDTRRPGERLWQPLAA